VKEAEFLVLVVGPGAVDLKVAKLATGDADGRAVDVLSGAHELPLAVGRHRAF
jgi:hypothetical protein